MCGRYSVSVPTADLMSEFEIDDLFDGVPEPDYNVAPTVAVPAIFERTQRESGEVRRRLAPLVWGLVPSWAKDRSIGSRMINARVETVAEKPAFRKAFASRRCLLPADGFYEWYAGESVPPPTGRGKPKPVKQPFFIHRADGGLLVMAGLYEIWRDPTKDPEDDEAWLRTCTVITTKATDAAGHIHDRMPMVITRDAVTAWLDPKLTDPDEAMRLLAVTEADLLEAYAVSTEVNSVQNNHPGLKDLLPADQTAPLTTRSRTGCSSPMTTEIIPVETPQGPGRLFLDMSPSQRSILILGHGAGGGVTAADLELLARRLPAFGVTVLRFEQPWRTAGRRIAGRPETLDEAWIAALGWIRASLGAGTRSMSAAGALGAGGPPDGAHCGGPRGGLPGVPAAPARPPGEVARARAADGRRAAAGAAGRHDAFGRRRRCARRSAALLAYAWSSCPARTTATGWPRPRPSPPPTFAPCC